MTWQTRLDSNYYVTFTGTVEMTSFDRSSNGPRTGSGIHLVARILVDLGGERSEGFCLIDRSARAVVAHAFYSLGNRRYGSSWDQINQTPNGLLVNSTHL